MVQRNKGLNFTIRFKGGGNALSLLNPVSASYEAPGEEIGEQDILTETSIPLLTETTDETIEIEDAVCPQPAMALDQSTVTLAGGLVNVWSDISLSLDYSASAGEEPITGTAGTDHNLSAAIDFGSTAGNDTDGLGENGATAKDAVAFLHSDSMTFMALIEYKTSNNVQTIFDSNRAAAAQTGFNVIVTNPDVLQVRVTNGTGTFVANPSFTIATGSLGFNSSSIVVVRTSGGLCQVNMIYSLYQNWEATEDLSAGTQGYLTWSAEVPLTGTVSTGAATYGPTIGAYARSSNTNRFTGSIGEIVAWNEALSDTCLTGAIYNLALKWRIFPGPGEPCFSSSCSTGLNCIGICAIVGD